MADYIYLLETRLSSAQQRAIGTIRTIARENEFTVFLTGGAVRDLTGGGSVRDLDLMVQGDVFRLKASLDQAGAEIYGENTSAQQLFLVMPGGVRVELSSAMNISYPKPGKPQYQPATLSDSLRTRDFTANAMAISLNEGSYGLLMDPLNGVADIENRELRLVSNYGFIEDPSRLIRAARFSSRLGWQMEARTRQRYDTAKEEGYISALADWNRGYELEEIFHEEDPVRILAALEAEGWMAVLLPALSSNKANTAALAELAERQGQLQTLGILAHSAALAFPLVTAKLSPAEVAALKQVFVRPGFAREIDELDTRTREFGTRMASKEAVNPSSAWKLLHTTEPNVVLSLAYSSKTPSIQSRLKTFLTDSPTARQRIPYQLMQEMRIVPELDEYSTLVEKLFFELMDGKLSSVEELKAFLEPYSPPAPPPPVNLRRARAKKEARPSRAKGKKAAVSNTDDLSPTVAAQEETAGVAIGLMEPGTLTGPNRGPEPTLAVPLQGKVAPEATTPSVGKPQTRKSVADATPTSTVPAPAAGSSSIMTKESVAKKPTHQQIVVVAPAAARKLTAQPVKAAPIKASPKPTPAVAEKGRSVASKPAPKKATAPVKSVVPVKKTAVAPAKASATKTITPVKKAVAPVKQEPAKKAVLAKHVALAKQPQAKAVASKATPAKGTPAKAAPKKLPIKKSAGRG